MRDRPIIMTGESVRAILLKMKTQTRRAVKLPKWSTGDWDDFETDGFTAEIICADTGCLADIACPYGQIGDRLWIKERWHTNSVLPLRDRTDVDYIYAADLGSNGVSRYDAPWKSPMFMPRAASRLTLEITNVRIERLQAITEEDAIADGCVAGYGPIACLRISGTWTARERYLFLWDSINGRKVSPTLQANPWVIALDFKEVTP